MSIPSLCIECLEGRTLLAAGIIDRSYTPYLEGSVVFDTNFNTALAGPDGTTLHQGGTPGTNFAIWRTRPDGSLDKSFGTGGKISIPNQASRIVLAPDGKIVILYAISPYLHINLARYNADGSPDVVFGPAGQRSVSIPRAFNPRTLAIQDDGKMLLGGDDDHNGALYRLNIDGTIDTTFGSGGMRLFPPTSTTSNFIEDIAIRRSDGRIVTVGGRASVDEEDSIIAHWDVRVLSPSGKVEWADTKPANFHGLSIAQVVVDRDGSIVVRGYAPDTTAPPDQALWRIILARYNQRQTTPLFYREVGPDDWGGKLSVDGNGHVLFNGPDNIRRLNYNLTADKSFGRRGRVNLGFHSFGLAPQSDGRIIVDGWSHEIPQAGTGEFRSLRLSSDYSPATLSGKTLRITGTDSADHMRVWKKGDFIGVFNDETGPWLFSASKINKLQIDGRGGDDTIALAKSLPSSKIVGGAGNDTLLGHRRQDRLFSIERIS